MLFTCIRTAQRQRGEESDIDSGTCQRLLTQGTIEAEPLMILKLLASVAMGQPDESLPYRSGAPGPQTEGRRVLV